MSNEIVAFFLSLTYQAMGDLGVRSVRPTIDFDVTGVAAFSIRLLAMDSTRNLSSSSDLLGSSIDENLLSDLFILAHCTALYFYLPAALRNL